MPRGHSTRFYTAGELWAEHGGDNARFIHKVSKKGRQYIALDTPPECAFATASKRGALLGLAVAHELRAAMNAQSA